MHAAVASVSQMVLEAADAVCVVDTDATVEQFLRVATIRADSILVVVEPYFTSLETGRRMTRLGKLQGYDHVALVANKVRSEQESETVYEFATEHGLEVAGIVPHDLRMPDAEWAQSAPLDFDPDSPSIAAIDELGRRLLERCDQTRAVADGQASSA